MKGLGLGLGYLCGSAILDVLPESQSADDSNAGLGIVSDALHEADNVSCKAKHSNLHPSDSKTQMPKTPICHVFRSRSWRLSRKLSTLPKCHASCGATVF